MNPEVHERVDLYCPHCLSQLIRVKDTGHTFCDDFVCAMDFLYVVGESRKTPITKRKALAERKKRSQKHHEQELTRVLNAAIDGVGFAFTQEVFDKVMEQKLVEK